ncbi:P-loop containing nucleoside triphosphate hydrolase protein [Dichotomopilus funicola]|uniref:RNA helicase n=1 Tax=Dichotomopilus funicola TaxID=1934379 RepID=A0AAN6V9F3_9PEZI|nr:P-loop containing nucleoside triphosphate hydrolase protein [Dichotomopilus funicola]
MKSFLGAVWKAPRQPTLMLVRWRTGSRRMNKKKKKSENRFVPGKIDVCFVRISTCVRNARHTRFPAGDVLDQYAKFRRLVLLRFSDAMNGAWEASQEEWRALGISTPVQLDKEAELFKTVLRKAFDLATRNMETTREGNPLFWNLRNAFIKGGDYGIRHELHYAFQTVLMRPRFPKAVTELHRELADLRFPYEWYPATRTMQRTIHLHVGPTNSGKTYNALQALQNSRSGIYAGPLRLLAHETYTRFLARNKPCALLTGEEVRVPTDADTWFHSCTVEMTPLNTKVDVAVIDEIQMINNPERGWAWTQAVLGVQAREVHLCGEERVVPLIESLCARTGEPLVVHRYERLNGLDVMPTSLNGDFSKLERGDAIVAFSKVDIHSLKTGIEQATGRRCAIVYGSLPPETRASQAALFNDPNNDYDFLVASDAIGMGLNLEVRRVVFYASEKFDGTTVRNLTVPEIRQIGGRAGRFRTAASANAGTDAAANTGPPTPGLVTTFEREDLRTIRRGFTADPPPITTAGILPPVSVLERFHSYFPPRTPTSFVLTRLRELCRLSSRFHMCDMTEAVLIAEAIKPFDLSIADRCVFLNVPVALRDPRQASALAAFAQTVAELGSGRLLDFPKGVIDLEVLELEGPEGPTRAERASYLSRLESFHHVISMYLWLSYRYQGVFQSQALAFQVKTMAEAKIADHLASIGFAADAQRTKRAIARKMARKAEQKERTILGPEPGVVEEAVETLFNGDGKGHSLEEKTELEADITEELKLEQLEVTDEKKEEAAAQA